MVAPITPEQCTAERVFPDFVIEAFNYCIKKNFSGHSATVRQKDVLAEIIKRGEISEKVVFDEHYLDVESLYRKNGWEVRYDKPGFNEDYEAYFRFSIKF